MTVKSNVTSHFKDISINPYIIVEAHVHDLPTAQGNIRNTLYFKRGKAHLKDMKINPKLHWDSSPWHYNGSRKASSKRSSFFFRSIYSWIIFDDSACLVFFWGMYSSNRHFEGYVLLGCICRYQGQSTKHTLLSKPSHSLLAAEEKPDVGLMIHMEHLSPIVMPKLDSELVYEPYFAPD